MKCLVWCEGHWRSSEFGGARTTACCRFHTNNGQLRTARHCTALQKNIINSHLCFQDLPQISSSWILYLVLASYLATSAIVVVAITRILTARLNISRRDATAQARQALVRQSPCHAAPRDNNQASRKISSPSRNKQRATRATPIACFCNALLIALESCHWHSHGRRYAHATKYAAVVARLDLVSGEHFF